MVALAVCSLGSVLYLVVCVCLLLVVLAVVLMCCNFVWCAPVWCFVFWCVLWLLNCLVSVCCFAVVDCC